MDIHKLGSVRSSDLKRVSWRSVFKKLAQSPQGAMVITRHQRPEAIILTVAEYERLLGLAAEQQNQVQNVLESLRRDFDGRLESFKDGELGTRARKAMSELIVLGGKIRVSSDHQY